MRVVKRARRSRSSQLFSQVIKNWFLTDTGEDSNFVRKRKCPKVDTLFFPFFPTRPSDEYFRLGAESYSSLGRVGKKGKNSVSTFGRFRLYRLWLELELQNKVLTSDIIIRNLFNVLRCFSISRMFVKYSFLLKKSWIALHNIILVLWY